MSDPIPEAPEPQVCYLTTMGRRSVRPRTIEIWFVRDGDCIYLISGEPDRAQWIKNIEADADATVRVGDVERRGRARVLREVEDADLLTRVRSLFDVKYGWSDGRAVEIALT